MPRKKRIDLDAKIAQDIARLQLKMRRQGDSLSPAYPLIAIARDRIAGADLILAYVALAKIYGGGAATEELNRP